MPRRALVNPRLLTRRYWLWLVVIVALACGTYLAGQRVLRSEGKRWTVVSLAAEQATRAERIGALALRTAVTVEGPERRRLVAEAQRTFREWQRGHFALRNGDDGLDVPAPASARVRERLDNLEPQRVRLAGALDRLGAVADSAGDTEAVAARVDRAVREIDTGMRRVLEAMDREHQDEIRQWERIASTVLLLTLLVLGLITLLVIHPAGRRLEVLIDDLTDKQEILRRQNTELEAAREAATGALAEQASAFAEVARSEAALREGELRMRSISDVLDDGIVMLDAAGAIRSCNAGAGRILGVEPHELFGWQLTDFPWEIRALDGSPLARDAHPVLAVLRDGVARRDRTVLAVLPNRGERWITLNAHPLRDAHDGHLTGVVASFRDVTELTRAAQAREEQATRIEVQAAQLERQNQELARQATELEERTTALASTRDYLQGVIDHSVDGIVAWDLELRYTGWNPAMERLVGIPASRIVGRHIYDCIPAMRGTERGRAHELACAGESVWLTGQVLHLPGRDEIVTDVNYSPLLDASGRVVGGIALVRDTTGRHRAERELRASEQRFTRLATRAPVGIFMTDAAGSFTFVNHHYLQITGVAAEHALGQGWIRVLHADDRVRVVHEWSRAAEAGTAFHGEHRVLRPDGELRWVTANAEPLESTDGQFAGYIGSVTDITERKRIEQRLQELTTVDELTRLLNRRGFLELADQAARAAARLSHDLVLFYADMNDFKHINDTLGHAVGDEALKDVASLLASAFRNADLVGRLGGDEFVALAVNAKPETERIVLERIERAIDEYNATAGRPYELNMSIGWARSAAASPVPIDVLMSRADASLYDDKRRRRQERAQRPRRTA